MGALTDRAILGALARIERRLQLLEDVLRAMAAAVEEEPPPNELARATLDGDEPAAGERDMREGLG